MKTNKYTSKIKSRKIIEHKASQILKGKYNSNVQQYNLRVTNNIIYNEKSRLVAVFKDYLILDDISEFMRRYYTFDESIIRLTKIIGFYESYSKIFPNYIIIPESKYLYKSIRRKQKLIDAFNQIKMEEEENRKNFGATDNGNKLKKEDQFFDSEIRNSIVKYKPSYYNYSRNNQSVFNSTEAILNNSYIMSLTINKNMENEESTYSIANILNSFEKKEEDKIQTETSRKLTKHKINEETKKKLKAILTDNILKTKNNQSENSKVNLPENKLKLKLNINLNTVNNTNEIYRNNVTNEPNSNSNTINIYNTINTSVGKDRTRRNKLPLKHLNINETKITSPLNANTMTNSVKTESTSDCKGVNHRTSPSLPQVYNSIKIINNYPNIIIPSGNTHVSINQNYFNYENNQTLYGDKMITVESIDNNDNDQNNGLMKLKVQNNNFKNREDIDSTRKNIKSDDFDRLKSVSHSTSKVSRKKVLSTKKIQQVVSNLFENIKPSAKSKDTKKLNLLSNPYTTRNFLHTKIEDSKTNSNVVSNDNNPQNYSKILKIFKDNYKVINTVGSKDIKQNKKIERLSSKHKRIKLGDQDSQFMRSKYKISHGYMNSQQDNTINLQTDSGINSKMNKKIYKTFIEKTKLECLTARNSIEKISYIYKILNTENDNKTKIDNFARINNNINLLQNKTNQEKTNLYLSPNSVINHLLRKTNRDKSYTNFNQTVIKTPPIKIGLNENTIKTEPNERIEEQSYNYNSNNATLVNATKINRRQKLKAIFNNPFETVSANNENTYNNSKTPHYSSKKLLTARNEVKSIDFQKLKMYKR